MTNRSRPTRRGVGAHDNPYVGDLLVDHYLDDPHHDEWTPGDWDDDWIGADKGGRGPEVLGLTAVVVCVIVVLSALGQGSLGTPPLGSFEALRHWLDGRDPVTAALAFVRVGALITAWYVLVTIVLGVLVRAVGWARLTAATDRVTLPMVRRLLGRAASISLTLSTLSVSAVPVVSTVLAPAPVGATELAAQDPLNADPGIQDGAVVPIMERLPDNDPELVGAGVGEGERLGPRLTREPDTPAMSEADEPDQAATPTPRDEWEIRSGDHLWCVAEMVLTDAWQRTPDNAEVVAYWRDLIVANRDRLVDPDNPDLVIPGQHLALPAVPAAP